MKTLKKKANCLIAAGTLSVLTLGTTVAANTPAHAEADTWKKVAIGAAVVTGYGLVKGKGKVAAIGAAATAGSYYMYDRAKDKEREEEEQRQAWYQQHYARNDYCNDYDGRGNHYGSSNRTVWKRRGYASPR
ncbi:MAG: hypothetical protein M3347_12685 [Armatimonadota bacterium]|nr:hypothetical protein [Armatimonadota bacterium]